MLNSIIEILSRYGVHANRFTLSDVVIIRGDNPEDIFYIVNISGSQFAVYETDYIGDLSFIYSELAQISQIDPRAINLLQKANKPTTLDKQSPRPKEAFVVKAQNSPYKYMVMQLNQNNLSD